MKITACIIVSVEHLDLLGEIVEQVKKVSPYTIDIHVKAK